MNLNQVIEDTSDMDVFITKCQFYSVGHFLDSVH